MLTHKLGLIAAWPWFRIRMDDRDNNQDISEKPNKMTQLWYRYVKRNVDLFFIAGLLGLSPPWFESKPKWYRTLWHVYQSLTDFILYFITVSNLIGAILLPSFLELLASLPPLIHGIQLSSRLIILQTRKTILLSYIKELNELLEEDACNPIDREGRFVDIHSSDFEMNRRLTKLEFVSLILSNSLFFIPECVKSFVEPDEAKVIIVSWYPYNATLPGYKQLTNFAHTFSWLLINFKMAAFDTLMQSLIILHASQFRQLRRLFGKVLPIEESQQIEALTQTKNNQINENLRWWIGQHRRTLSATKKLQDLCSPLLFFSYIECLFNMCLAAFLATVESPWTPLQRFSAVCVVGTVFLQMFVMCRLGDYITESSLQVPEMGYNPTLFRSNQRIQKSMIMVLNRIHLPVRFTAMNLFYLDSKQYGVLVQGVFSYYMALRQLQSRN